MNYAVKTALADSKSSGDELHPSLGWGDRLFYFFDLFRSQSRTPISLSSCESTFVYGIGDIVFSCSKKKMKWIAAWGIVTAMTAIEFFIKLSSNKKVCQSVCGVDFSSEHHGPITKLVFPTSPGPAFVQTSNFHLAPKPFLSSLSLHKSVVLICATLSARQGARAFSFSQITA